MKTLTDRKRYVLQARYFGRENNLGLTVEYFREVLHFVELKLASTLSKINVDVYEPQKEKENIRSPLLGKERVIFCVMYSN
jgi:hypothetical protein